MKSFQLLAMAILLAATARAEVRVGELAPDFTLTDTAGKQHKLSDYKGKIVVLEWTNPECPFVQRHYGEPKTMINLARSNPDVIWLAIDSTSTRSTADDAQWAQKDGIAYPILSDQDGSVGKMYGAKTTPHMFIINPEGNVAYEGGIDNNPRGTRKATVNYVEKALDELKTGKPVADAQTKPYGCSVKYK